MYTNSSFIGKHIYQHNQSEYIIFLSSKYNPISFKNNINKISNKIKNDSIEIPKPKDIIDNITTKEQLIELRKLLNTYNSYENNIDIKELKKTRR